MKNIYLVLIFILINFSNNIALAQSNFVCGSGAGGSNFVGNINMDNIEPLQTEGPFYIRLYFNITTRLDGSGGQSESIIEEGLKILAEEFNPHNIFFIADCNINYIAVEDEIFDEFDLDLQLPYCHYWSNENYLHDDGINVFIGKESYSNLIQNPAGGIANGIPGNSIFIGGYLENENLNALESRIFSHEIGHLLGLFHTQHRTINETFTDCEGITWDSGICCELVNGDLQNRTECGDYVFDTNPDPGIALWYTINTPSNPCQGEIFWSNGTSPIIDNNICFQDISSPATSAVILADENGDEMSPIPYNTMASGNSHYSCTEGYTTGQGQRMREMITTETTLQNMLISRQDYTEIFNNESWNANTFNAQDIYFEENLVIRNGAKLVIESDLTLRFSENGKLIIEPNAELVLNGTLSSRSCIDSWLGVEVWGNSSESQFKINGNLSQGSLKCKPGSFIENAEIGIFVGGPDEENQSGGIVSIEQSNFYNNRISIKFSPYQNFVPFDTPFSSQDQPRSNFSRINKSSFYCDDSSPHDLFTFIQLTGVNGILIGGSSFINEGNSIVETFGSGIFANDAGFKTTFSCNGNIYPCPSFQKCIFKGLNHGIDASTIFDGKPFQVIQSEFENCNVGIKINGVGSSTILHNEFKLGVNSENGQDEDVFGIFLDGEIAGIELQENLFKENSNSTQNSVGIHARDIGEFNNVIRRNVFEDLDYGNIAEGINGVNDVNGSRGLLYLCNNNNNKEIDFSVIGVEGALIKVDQGQEYFDAEINEYLFNSSGNIFSDEVDNFINNGVLLTYYHNQNNNEIPFNFTNLILDESNEGDCSMDNCEPPCYTETEIEIKKQNFNTDEDNYNIAILELEDEDNSDEELNNIINSRNFFRKEMDNNAYDIVTHMHYDTLTYNEDSLNVWKEKFELLGIDLNLFLRNTIRMGISTIQFETEKITNNYPENLDEIKVFSQFTTLFIENSPYYKKNIKINRLYNYYGNDKTYCNRISKNIMRLHEEPLIQNYLLPERSNLQLVNAEITEKSNNFSVFPNPNEGTFSINSTDTSGVIIVFNIHGEIVLKKEVSEINDFKCNLRNQNNGLYFLSFMTLKGEIFTSKIVISR
jgi:hypothetical protein